MLTLHVPPTSAVFINLQHKSEACEWTKIFDTSSKVIEGQFCLEPYTTYQPSNPTGHHVAISYLSRLRPAVSKGTHSICNSPASYDHNSATCNTSVHCFWHSVEWLRFIGCALVSVLVRHRAQQAAYRLLSHASMTGRSQLSKTLQHLPLRGFKHNSHLQPSSISKIAPWPVIWLDVDRRR